MSELPPGAASTRDEFTPPLPEMPVCSVRVATRAPKVTSELVFVTGARGAAVRTGSGAGPPKMPPMLEAPPGGASTREELRSVIVSDWPCTMFFEPSAKNVVEE